MESYYFHIRSSLLNGNLSYTEEDGPKKHGLFCLSNTNLWFFTKETDQHPRGAIALEGALVFRSTSDPKSFAIETSPLAGLKRWRLTCLDEEQTDIWWSVIR